MHYNHWVELLNTKSGGNEMSGARSAYGGGEEASTRFLVGKLEGK